MTVRYRLRGFLRDDPREIERLNLMYYHPAVAKAKGYWSRRFARFSEVSLSEDEALCGHESTKVRRESKEVSYAVADDGNNLVGWVWFYQDSRHPLPRRIAKKYKVTPRMRVFAISYEKMLHEGWPKEIVEAMQHVRPDELVVPHKGVIVEGLRMSLSRLKTAYRRLYRRVPRILTYAFVLPRNYASQAVLRHNRFELETRMYRCEGVLHQVWVREL